VGKKPRRPFRRFTRSRPQVWQARPERLSSLCTRSCSRRPHGRPVHVRGWAVDFDGGPDGDRFKLEEARNAEALLLGRVTYEAMHAFWPTEEGEFADRLNELPKYVVSSALTDPPWNARVLGDDWPQEVARLRKELDGDIVVYGSRRLSQALLEMGLVDELRLMVYPLVLGT
jgi:dihydrofolate reductase